MQGKGGTDVDRSGRAAGSLEQIEESKADSFLGRQVAYR